MRSSSSYVPWCGHAHVVVLKVGGGALVHPGSPECTRVCIFYSGALKFIRAWLRFSQVCSVGQKEFFFSLLRNKMSAWLFLDLFFCKKKHRFSRKLLVCMCKQAWTHERMKWRYLWSLVSCFNHRNYDISTLEQNICLASWLVGLLGSWRKRQVRIQFQSQRSL
jgi:hypothetical protein